MTKPLGAESPRRAAAREFSSALRALMRRRRIGRRRVAAACRVAQSAVGSWIAGSNLPTLEVAGRVAELLDAPALAEIVLSARRGECETCGRGFVNEGGSVKRYCSDGCRDVAAKKRSGGPIPPDRKLLEALMAELGRPGPPRKRVLRALLETYRRERRRSTTVFLERRLRLHAGTVMAMCGACEPDGRCRTPRCELRPVSPHRLAADVIHGAADETDDRRLAGPRRLPPLARTA